MNVEQLLGELRARRGGPLRAQATEVMRAVERYSAGTDVQTDLTVDEMCDATELSVVMQNDPDVLVIEAI